MATQARYAALLLKGLGARLQRTEGPPGLHSAVLWAQCGAMALTGHAGSPARMLPAPLASCAEGALQALNSLAPGALLDDFDAALLGERAALSGFARRGRQSAGGGCHLLRCADAWIAINLARREDWELLPAWLEQGVVADANTVASAVCHRSAADLVERGRLLGLALALSRAPMQSHWFVEHEGPTGRAREVGEVTRPLVLDLSSLWAGPLCADLLGACGARVIKVESTARPDGLRHGPASFFDLLNGRKSSLALPLHTEQGRRQLAALIAQADVVVEASRPRALAQLGVDAVRMVRQHPGLAWISITGHGRHGEAANWVAFGDDAAVAGGLSWLLVDARNDPVFCADAIADPLAGLHAAVLAWGALLAGGGIYAVAMKDVVAHCALFNPPAHDAWRERGSEWERELVVSGVTAAQPRARRPSRVARPCGSDTESVLAELGVQC